MKQEQKKTRAQLLDEEGEAYPPADCIVQDDYNEYTKCTKFIGEVENYGENKERRG